MVQGRESVSQESSNRVPTQLWANPISLPYAILLRALPALPKLLLLVLPSVAFLNDPIAPMSQHRSECYQRRTTTPITLRAKGKNDAGTNTTAALSATPAATADDLKVVAVSDAEALLACRAALVRTQQLPWTRAQQRGRRREEQRRSNANDPLTHGFFWHDPSQLIYLHKEHEFLETSGAQDDIADIESMDRFDEDINLKSTAIYEIPPYAPLSPASYLSPLPYLPQAPVNVRDGDALAIDWNEPSPEHVRRSAAAQLRWHNPAWKAYWYERRWGGTVARQQRQQRQAQQRLQQRLRGIQPESLLANPRLANMTAPQMTHAIETYVHANQKRRQSQREHVQHVRNATLPSFMPSSLSPRRLPRDALLATTNATLVQQRQARAQRAVQAYQTRLSSLSRPNTKPMHIPAPTVPVDGVVDAMTPREALRRIERDLDAHCMTHPDIVQVMLQPDRLPRRRHVLRRILADYFDLRGKCVPTVGDDDNHDATSPQLQFVTTCSIAELGKFCVTKLREAL